MAEGVIQVGEYGPIFELRDPHTVESLKIDADRASGRHGLCRIKHRWQVIGKPYLPSDDPRMATYSLVASQMYDRLIRCRRCGCIKMRGRL